MDIVILGYQSIKQNSTVELYKLCVLLGNSSSILDITQTMDWRLGQYGVWTESVRSSDPTPSHGPDCDQLMLWALKMKANSFSSAGAPIKSHLCYFKHLHMHPQPPDNGWAIGTGLATEANKCNEIPWRWLIKHWWVQLCSYRLRPWCCVKGML